MQGTAEGGDRSTWRDMEGRRGDVRVHGDMAQAIKLHEDYSLFQAL